MTWPPSCHAASLWSTLTPRTSPSLTKETGWSDGDQAEDKCVQVPPYNPALHTSPSESPFCSGKRQNIVVAHFSSVALFFFFYLSRCGLCSKENLHVTLVCLSSVPRELFEYILCALPHILVSSGFLVMKSPMFSIVIHENIFFEKPLVFVSYLYVDVKKKNENGKMKACYIYP